MFTSSPWFRSTQGCDLGSDGPREGPNINEVIQAVSSFKKAALLGQSFLVKRLLRRYDWSRCGDDSQVCQIPRAKGPVHRTSNPRDLTKPRGGTTHLARPLRGQGLDPPMGGEIKAGSFGPGFFTLCSLWIWTSLNHYSLLSYSGNLQRPSPIIAKAPQ